MVAESPSPRRSSRARKARVTVYDDAKKLRDSLDSTASSPARRKKRKSEELEEEVEEENDAEMTDAQSSAAESDDESSEEEASVAPSKKPKRKLSQPPRRNVRFSTATTGRKKAPRSSLAARRSAPNALLPLARKILDDDETPETSLLAALLKAPVANDGKGSKQKPATLMQRNLERAARRVVALQSKDPNAAQCELINLLFRSIGGRRSTAWKADEVDLETVDDDTWQDMVTQLVQDMQETPVDQVLVAAVPPKKAGSREFGNIFRKFWRVLATVALNYSGSEDEDDESKEEDDAAEEDKNARFRVEVVRGFASRLFEMVAFGQPDIRSAATTAVYRMTEGMLEHANDLQEKLEKSNRQLRAAKRSKQKLKAAALTAQIKTWKSTVEDLLELSRDVVEGVLLKRYRDSNPHIRAESISSLTQFILLQPNIFGQPTYLKYAAWMLSDKDASVRMASLRAFLLPLQHKVDQEMLKPVIDKFIPRLADCVLDKDSEVQELAMSCLLELSRKDLLDSLEDDTVWEQINVRALAPEMTPAARRDALYFVLEQLQAFDNTQKTETLESERIAELVDWVSHVLAEGDIPLDRMRFDLIRFVVESLRAMPEHKSLVCNWAAFLRALKADKKASVDQRIESTQQRVLLEMMVQSAELEVRASSSEKFMLSQVDPDLLAAQEAQDKSAVQPPSKKRKQGSSHEELTIALLRSLPSLLGQFKNDVSVQRNLTGLAQYFLPSVFNLPSRKKEFNSLISKLSQTFLEASDRVVLHNCALALSSLSKGDHARSEDAQLKLQTTAVKLCKRVLDVVSSKYDMINGTDKDVDERLDIEHAAVLALRRLAVLSKQVDISMLLVDEDQTQRDARLEQLCSEITKVIGEELKRRELEDGDEPQIPAVWQDLESTVHTMVSDSVHEALTFLLSTTAWRLRLQLQGMDNDKPDADAEIVKRMRDSLVKLLVLCYEQYIDIDDESLEYTEDHIAFSNKVQASAGRIAGDLRSLFPKIWADTDSKLLRSLAFVEDGHLIGGYVRFMQMKSDERDEEGNLGISADMLMPVARAVAPNWKQGVRREAGVLLSHVAGSGPSARELVVSFSRVLKRVEPVRLLEAHMSCLCEDFDEWTNSEPDELDSQHPSEDEMAAFEEAEKHHKSQFALLEQRAQRLSATLGVGKITDKSIASSILGFVREGLRFAFSTNIRGQQEELPLGTRLPFLRILSKYIMWIRKNHSQVGTLRDDFNDAEKALRADEDYAEIFDSDKTTIVEFRKVAGLGPYEAEETDSIVSAGTFSASSRTSRRQPRLSLMSGISSIRSKASTKGSLSPLQEREEDSDGSGGQMDAESVGMQSTIASPSS